MSNWAYYKFDSMPCRIKMQNGKAIKAEIYEVGVGFTQASPLLISDEGRPLNKAEFDALLMLRIQQNKADA
ncbi:MAG: hypothetical protein J0M34_07290 [Alphaproteobacteria bacterium]|nr:hypothetical protein [Alphaproteobacteria bacterium]